MKTASASRVAQRHLQVCKAIDPVITTAVVVMDGDSLQYLLRENGVDAHDVVLFEAEGRYRWEGRDSNGEFIDGAFTLGFRSGENGIEVARDIYLRDGRVRYSTD